VPDVSAPLGLRLRITSGSGSVTIHAEDRSDVVVGNGTMTPASDGVLEIRPARPSQSLDVRCPGGTDVMVGTASGRIELRGPVGAASATTTSARVTVEAATAADLRTVSGGIEVGTCLGRCRASTQSGSIRVRQADEVAASTVAGSIEVGVARAGVQVRTVSGTVAVGADGAGAIAVKTVSGGVSLRLAHGVRPELHIRTFGTKSTAVETGHDVRVEITSVSGTVKVQPR
jgi:DUF4097 and DUF4098 domain-containing protein YvlB